MTAIITGPAPARPRTPRRPAAVSQPMVAAVAPVLPEHAYPQAQITETIAGLVTADPGRAALLRRLHASAGVDTRHLALPLEEYAGLTGFDQANALFAEHGRALAARAARTALADAGLTPADVDHLWFTTVTGVAAPALDVALVTDLGLRPDVSRLPSFGLGCAGGAAGLARLRDHLLGRPDQVALLVSVELCSLTLQREDSTANLVATGLFGDGAAAAVLLGADRAAGWSPPAEPGHGRGPGPGSGPEPAANPRPQHPATRPRVVASRSVLYPGTDDALGWRVGSDGLRIVLSGGLPDAVRAHVGQDVAALLADLGAEVGDVAAWLVHPGGPKILDAAADALHLRPGDLATSRACLAEAGNLSSAAVLHVLDRAMADPPPPGSLAVLVAFGPGVGAELVALEWAAA